MTAMLWLPALSKVLTTALLVISASTLAEKLGPFWGAVVASLPVSVGPAYVFLAMQHSNDFVAASALSSCAANAATGIFLTVFGTQARNAPFWRSLALAVGAWLVASAVIQQLSWTPAMGVLLNLAVYGIGFRLLKTTEATAIRSRGVTRSRWFELLVRAIAVASFVATIIVISSIIGPTATGVAAVFPVSLISLIIILYPRAGAPASVLLAANSLRAMLGYSIMFVVLHLAVPLWGTAVALVMALLVSVAWSGGLLIQKYWLRAH